MATATTVTIISSPSSPFMLPGMSSADSSRVVRFSDECVLIPESPRAKRRMLTKSYSLPLWKRKPTQFSDSEADESPSTFNNVEETRVVLKVPLPTFRAKSPHRGRSVSSSPPTAKPLSPCLVHRSPSSASTSHTSPTLSPVRRPSLPIYHKNRDDSALTIPLRACCQGCERVIEESLRRGDTWTENFTRGARRRRAASLDTGSSSSAFGSVKLSSSLPDASPIASGLQTSTFAITVDEVDRRHRSQNHTGRSASFSESSSPVSPSGPRYPHDRSHERDTSYESVSSSNSEDLTPETIDSRRRLRSSPIEEEDETQLFPLPSPRRSPSGSGASSPAASPKPTPVPSPNASTSCLDKPASSSKESISSATGSSEDGVLKHSLSRKTPDGLLSPSLSSTITVDAPRPPRPTLPRTHERKVSLPTPVSPKGPRPPLSLSLPMPTKQPNTPSSARDTPLTPPPSSLAHTPKRPEEPEQTRHERRGSDAGRTAERRQWDVWGSLLTLSSGVVRI